MKGKFFGGDVQWNEADVSTLEFRKSGKRDDFERLLPNSLFRFLSNTTCDDVSGFLHLLGLPRLDFTTSPAMPDFANQPRQLRDAWEDYITIRLVDRHASFKAGKKAIGSRTLRRRFESKYGFTAGRLLDYYYRVQRAAYSVIGLYVGGRYSDLTSFVSGCVREQHGGYVLVGTETKHVPETAPENRDVWPAINIMRDALVCLEQISRVTCNPYLISGRETVAPRETPAPLSLTGLCEGMTHYLREVDTNGSWASWRISSNQLRHTLVHQLARADVSTVFISYQLKHLYTALAELPPDVTLGYGNLTEQRMQRATASAEANAAAARALFDPDRAKSGGLGDEFNKRMKVYFEGRMAAGMSKEEVILELAAAGNPFVNVGPGYCGGVREEEYADGTKEKPPCLGQLECNTGTCHNSVITQIHKVHWAAIRDKNKEYAKDPRLSHAAEHFREAVETANKVLNDLDASTTDDVQDNASDSPGGEE
ncbi:hypothetical protein [Variovorax sp. RA8]|uniref:hypothetical protein n=1 Tax=Variovorax sp. (strain JCM 16519 / RA8) TaxID=662548 RepID=UPI000A7F2E23|nr:hypothetical protein [Variovorax sp. RA8]